MKGLAGQLLAILASVTGLATAAGADQTSAKLDTANDFAIRATLVRERLEEIERRQVDPMAREKAASPKQAQWLNFPNWPNWNNWANYWNNWGNVYR